MHRRNKFFLPSATALGVAAIALSACTSAEVSAIKAASQDQIRSVRVSEIAVKTSSPTTNSTLEAALEAELRGRMQECATGSVDHRMDVTIVDFEEASLGQAIFLADEIELKGRVELTEVATGNKAGEYFVERSFAWGGIMGAAMMADPENSMSEGFADSVCEDIFAKTAE